MRGSGGAETEDIMHLRPKESKSAASHSEVAASWPDLPGSGEMLWTTSQPAAAGHKAGDPA